MLWKRVLIAETLFADDRVGSRLSQEVRDQKGRPLSSDTAADYSGRTNTKSIAVDGNGCLWRLRIGRGMCSGIATRCAMGTTKVSGVTVIARPERLHYTFIKCNQSYHVGYLLLPSNRLSVTLHVPSLVSVFRLCTRGSLAAS